MFISTRRWPAFLLAFLMLLFAGAAVQAREMVSAARDDVQMRSGPGSRYAAKWTLSRGYPLSIVSRKGAWLKVRDFENDQGWVLSARTARTPHYVSKAKALPLRSTPAPRARVLARASYGDVLRTLERRGDWVKVRKVEGGQTGWVPRNQVWGW